LLKNKLKMKKTLLTLGVAFGLTTNAKIITTIAGNGTGAYAGDGAQATAAELNAPLGAVLDGAGNLYIADTQNNCVRMVNTLGIITTIAGNGTGGYSGDGSAATAAELGYPAAVALDAAGNIYIADAGNNRIRKVSTIGVITTIAGTGVAFYSGDGGQATAARLNYPMGVTLDTYGNLYIADLSNNVIRKVNTSGIINTIVGTGIAGYSGDGGQATAAELNQPYGVALDAVGNLYIPDYNNNVIRMINTSGIITTIAGNGSFGFSGDGGQATAAELNSPKGVTFDAVGNLYIADFYNSRVRKITTTGIISTVAGNGTAGFSGDGGNATSAEIEFPYGVALDAAGSLYIADGSNNRIRKVTCSVPTLSVTASAGTVCAGQAATLTASGASTYLWNISATSHTIVVTPTATTTYTVTGTMGVCMSIQTITVNANPLPTVTVNSPTICVGATTTLTASGNAVTYSWSTSTTTTITVTPTVTTTYILTGIGGNSCTNTATSTVTVNPTNFGVAFTATQQLLTAPPFIAQFTNSTPSPANYTFTWLFGDSTNQQTNNATVFHTYSYNGNYNVTLVATSNTTGCTDTLYQGGYIFCSGGTSAGIKQVTGANNQVTVYPNPTNGNFIIETTSAGKQTMQVFDLNGKVVLSQTINGKAAIDASSLNEGVYSISIISSEGVTNRKLVIVR